MSLIRDISFPVEAHPDTLLATCSALVTTGSTGVVTPIAITTAQALISTGDIGNVNSTVQGDQVSSGGMVESTHGRIIDRLRYPQAGAHYQVAVVQATLTSTRGSSEADRKLAVGVELWHGDSSGGGDLAEYSTGSRPRDRVYFTSARTTVMANWDTAESSGPAYLISEPGYYDLRGAKRYLQVRPRFGKNSVTTESSGDEGARAGATLVFAAGDVLPEPLDTTSPYSTSTSTST